MLSQARSTIKLSIPSARIVGAFGMGLMMQALLSGANFAVGLILIRRTADLQYSYYVLAANAILLLTSLQNSFVQPYIVANVTSNTDAVNRRRVIGAVASGNRRWVPLLCTLSIAIAVGLWEMRLFDTEQTVLIALALIAGGAALGRELFRMTLFAYHRPFEVLRGDVAYVVALVCGAFVATLTPKPAVFAVVTLTLAALLGGTIARQGLWAYEAWDVHSTQPVFRKMASMGTWAVAGSAIHWLLIYGYSYLVAGVLDVRDVAAIAATRLSLMPVFVLSGGVSMLLFPITSRWIHDLGTHAAARRLVLLVVGLCAAAILYMGVMWIARDWIFGTLLKKDFAQRDSLLIVWCAVFLVTLCRDQLSTLPAAHGRFRPMTLVTGVSVLVWLFASYLAMMHFGPVGAVAGILIGELINILGIVVLIVQQMRQPHVAAAY
jgi:O-antigen/teichoic acid export membrane protein